MIEQEKDSLDIISKAASEVVTQSEMMLRAACPRKWLYRYALKLERRSGVNYHFVYGDIIHQALATLYKSKWYGTSYKVHPIAVPYPKISEDIILTPEDREELVLIHRKAQITFNAYRLHYAEADKDLRILNVEDTFELDWKGVKLQGKLDMVAHPKLGDGIFIWDFKTAGRFDAKILDAWSFRFQFLFYCWLYWRVTGNLPTGTMVCGIAKTQLRPKIIDKKTEAKEAPEQYLKRVQEDMFENRSRMFYRQRMPLVDRMLLRFEKEMLQPHLDAFKHIQKKGPATVPLTMAMNTGQCHMYNSFCEYLPLCKDGELMLGEYITRKDKHAELTDGLPEE
jgi:hypothetical protein